MKSFEERRREIGITQTALARNINVSRQTIVNWEKTPEMMPLGKWVEIAGYLNVDPSYIF